MVKNLPARQDTWVQSLGREHILEKGMGTTPVFLPGKFHGQRSLAGYTVHHVAKSWTQLSNAFTFFSITNKLRQIYFTEVTHLNLLLRSELNGFPGASKRIQGIHTV